MHTNLLLSVAVVFAMSVSAMAAEGSGEKKEAGEKGALYHVVSVKFKETATPEQIKAVEDAFAALKTKIPGVVTLHGGVNVSPEKHSKGFTHCFVLTFASDKDRDDYLVHPAHKEFGKTLGPVMADVMVLDFWSKE